ncbi:hypothetical protein IMG5_039650, partial [Ichthyophthirius multifiliis]
TGVYIGIKDYPNKMINDEDEDEKSHLDLKKEKLIKYIGFSQSHQLLMQNKTISSKPEESITAGVFREKQINNPDDEQNQQNQNQQQQQNYVYIPELDKELKMQYFKLPKLGSFIAFPLIFFSYLKEEFFNDLLLKKQLYLQSLEKWETEKKTKEKEILQEIEKLKEQPQLANEKEIELQNFLNEYSQPPQDPEPLFELKEYVLCADTMGQDRPLKQEEITYLEDYVILFANSWEEMERKILLKDVDLQIKYLQELPIDLIEKYDTQEAYIEEETKQQIDEMKEGNEKNYQFQIDNIKLQKLKLQICEDEDLKKHIFYLKNFRIIKFPKILQNIFYLLGYKRESINIENTHILDWKKTKEFINENDFFQKILNYQHQGPKSFPVEIYALINRIQSKLEKFNLQEVYNYNIGLGRLFKWAMETCRLRKIDIEIRRQIIAENIQEIEKKTLELDVWNNELNNKLQEAINIAQANALAQQTSQGEENIQEIIPFNEIEWKTKFEEENIRPVVPEKLPEEEDIDYEF